MLRREIADVQQQGWAQAVKEREDDLNAIAAPVYGANGRLAAILGVQGPAAAVRPQEARGGAAAAAGAG